MNHSILIILMLTFSFSSVAQKELKVASAEISFLFVNNDVDGTLTGFKSESIIDFDQIENSKLKGSVAVETISTGNSIRDWSLRRSKYFDADTYPRITFESTSVKKDGDDINVNGKLTIKDVTKDVTFNFEKKGDKLVGKTSLVSSDYGINIKSEREKNKVQVKIVLQLK